MEQQINIEKYNPNWISEFNQEKMRIMTVLHGHRLYIEHIGSTAIHAKPVVDILAVVRSIDRVIHFNDKMERVGYKARGENGIAGRRFFSKGGDERSHHVHMFQTGHEDIARHLAFRDYMLAHPHEAERYSQLKLRLAAEFPIDMEEYVNGKNEFIKVIDERAKRWVIRANGDRDVL
ncbi:GrpB family protein [Peribacillus muralis]|uniref:GrpB family protein n=1 Tax=Peribacillus muralis TaxID=264697 RepID=UPI003D0145C8